jgi:hypothetical protein
MEFMNNNTSLQEKMTKASEKYFNEKSKEDAKAFMDMYYKLLTAMYDKEISYTNLIIVAGYGVFFGLWQIVKDHIEPKSVLWAIILMSISASLFTIFEIIKGALTSISYNRIQKVFTETNNPKIEEIQESINKVEIKNNKMLCKFYYFHGFIWLLTVITGLSAVCIFIYNIYNKVLIVK